MNESEYIRYFLLNQSEHPRSRELEIMRLRNEINKIRGNIYRIVKNNNSHMYNDSDKIKLTNYLSEIVAILQA